MLNHVETLFFQSQDRVCVDAFRCFLQFRSFEPEGPPDEIEEIGEALHTCEDQLVRNLEGFPGFPASPYPSFHIISLLLVSMLIHVASPVHASLTS